MYMYGLVSVLIAYVISVTGPGLLQVSCIYSVWRYMYVEKKPVVVYLMTTIKQGVENSTYSNQVEKHAILFV